MTKLYCIIQFQLPSHIFPFNEVFLCFYLTEIPLFHVLNARVTFSNLCGCDEPVTSVTLHSPQECIDAGTNPWLSHKRGWALWVFAWRYNRGRLKLTTSWWMKQNLTVSVQLKYSWLLGLITFFKCNMSPVILHVSAFSLTHEPCLCWIWVPFLPEVPHELKLIQTMDKSLSNHILIDVS